ncbi:MAG: hypothetical protein AAGG75_15945 [Bacteroidota bacterium]
MSNEQAANASQALLSLIQEERKRALRLLQELPLDPDLALLCEKELRAESESEDALGRIYHVYPLLFSSLFFGQQEQSRDSSLFSRLCLAGFFIYRYVVKSDAVFDRNRQAFDNQDLLAAFTYLEEGIKLLSTLFGYESAFWKIWNRRKREHAQGIALNDHIEGLDWDLYEILADCKSTFGKVAIDAIHLLKGDAALTEAHGRLLLSHRYFSVGFQIMDDIQDFVEDLRLGQSNIALLYLADHKGVDFRQMYKQPNAKQLQQDFIQAQLDKQLYRKALSYLEMSKEVIAQDADKLPLWLEVLNYKIASNPLSTAD